MISDYQVAVAKAVALITASGILRPHNSMAWMVLDTSHIDKLDGQVEYFKHGAGCAVRLPDGPVDFDFGRAGEIDGFDAGRLGLFARNRLHEYGFSSESEVQRVFGAALEAGKIRYSGDVLYYLADEG